MQRVALISLSILVTLTFATVSVSAAEHNRKKGADKVAELPEVVVSTHKDRLLHILAYVREYSALTNYTDTIFLFREKMVDYMLPTNKKIKFEGWTKPRVLSSESYYRFSNNRGLDSVSNNCNLHFSWSDWMSLPPTELLPEKLRGKENCTDTVTGRYGAVETWTKDMDRVTHKIDVTADASGRECVPDFDGFFEKNIEFDKFDVFIEYDNVNGDYLLPSDVESYSYNLDSYGRGHKMFGFSRSDQPYYVKTDATAYIIDREYITVKEAKKWVDYKYTGKEEFIFASSYAPALEKPILELIDRVLNIDSVSIRINDKPDIRLSTKYNVKKKFNSGEILLQVLKEISGISQMQRDRDNFKENNRWKKYFKHQKENKGK